MVLTWKGLTVNISPNRGYTASHRGAKSLGGREMNEEKATRSIFYQILFNEPKNVCIYLCIFKCTL